jgi:Family of unknown function (DUF5641)
VVVVNDGNLARKDWKKGIIVETFPGKDGQVRVVLVKTADGVYKRPVTKIGVLNVCNKEDPLQEETEAVGVIFRMDYKFKMAPLRQDIENLKVTGQWNKIMKTYKANKTGVSDSTTLGRNNAVFIPGGSMSPNTVKNS